ncbi:MAG TPA: helix-turn-helix domain-containing protein [Gemmata sp.]
MESASPGNEPATGGAGATVYLTPKEVADTYRTTVQSVNRWLTIGLTVWNGRRRVRVRLRGQKIGGRWRIAADALEAFLKACGYTGAEGWAAEVRSETETERKRRVDAAKAKLTAAGLL